MDRTRITSGPRSRILFTAHPAAPFGAVGVLDRGSGHLVPLLGFKLDDGGVGAAAPALSDCPSDARRGPPPQWREKQQRADDIGYKAWKYQKDSARHGGKAG